MRGVLRVDLDLSSLHLARFILASVFAYLDLTLRLLGADGMSVGQSAWHWRLVAVGGAKRAPGSRGPAQQVRRPRQPHAPAMARRRDAAS